MTKPRLNREAPAVREPALEQHRRSRAARTAAAIRINARLDDATARELERLIEETGDSVTDVIKSAIHCYHSTLAGKARRSVFELFSEAGLIGCASGPSDLSTHYKEYLTESLLEKHGGK